MTALILAMLICLGIAVVVVMLVAVPARREGRDVLTARGEAMVGSIRDRAEGAKERAEAVRPRRHAVSSSQ